MTFFFCLATTPGTSTVSSTAAPPVSSSVSAPSSTEMTTTPCPVDMIGDEPSKIPEYVDVESAENPEGENPNDIFTEDGWSPEPSDEPSTIEITPNEGTEVTSVNKVTIDVENVKNITVQITTPTGEVETFTIVSY